MLPHWTQSDSWAGGARLHYYRTGRGDKRPLVLVHGFSDNGLCWASVARELESDYDVIMPDMHGHGLSARVLPGEKVDMAADLAEFIKALGLRRPIVAGHSMGAMAAYQLGVRYPELVGALVLEDPPWWLSPQPSAGRPAESPVAWAKDLPNHSLEELLAGYRRDHPSWSEEFVRIMCESKKQLDPAIVDIMARTVGSRAQEWPTTVAYIMHPILIITGDPKLGGIVTPEVAARVRELNPHVTIVNVPDVGHLIRFDNHEAFMKAMRRFLEQIPS